jgi:pimeloyl-ACP methyl ester carboxylesterase
MTTIVLVPGMWLGAWAWQDVTRHLAEAGHDARPVTLTGLAERASEASAATNLDTHVADVVTLLEKDDLRDVVLVGHSYGGMVVSTAAGRVAHRLRRVVYVDSVPLPEGMSQFDTTPPDEQERIRAQVGDGYLVPVPPFDPALEGAAGSAQDASTLAGLDERALARIRAGATPHPFASVTQPVTYTPAFFTVPAALITCLFPQERVRELIDAGDPYFALLRGADVYGLPTGHWPMFSRPEELARLLDRIARPVIGPSGRGDRAKLR